MFKFEVGSLETNKKWNAPTFEVFNKWYSKWTSTNNLSGYEIYLVGGFAEKLMNPLHETSDVDIVLKGDINNYKTLKSILNNGMSIGFKHNLLIDISWVNDAVWNQHLSIRRGAYTNKNQFFSRIRTFYKVKKNTNGNIIETDFSKSFEVIELIDGLYQLNGFDATTTNKVVKHMSDDIYKGIYMELKYVAREI